MLAYRDFAAAKSGTMHIRSFPRSLVRHVGCDRTPQLPYYLVQTVAHRRVTHTHARGHLLERAAAHDEIGNKPLLLLCQTHQRRQHVVSHDLRIARMAIHRPYAQHAAARRTSLWQSLFLRIHIFAHTPYISKASTPHTPRAATLKLRSTIEIYCTRRAIHPILRLPARQSSRPYRPEPLPRRSPRWCNTHLEAPSRNVGKGGSTHRNDAR